MITEMLATQQAERQTVTINTAAYDVRVSNPGLNSFLRQCRNSVPLSGYGFRYFQCNDNIIIRSIIVQVPAPIAVSTPGIPISFQWINSNGDIYDIPEICESIAGVNFKRLSVPFENSELVINTPCSFPIGSAYKAAIALNISQGALLPDHFDCRFHMTGLNAAYNEKVIPITVYARIEHTLPMITD